MAHAVVEEGLRLLIKVKGQAGIRQRGERYLGRDLSVMRESHLNMAYESSAWSLAYETQALR